jgi:DNA-binding GntR family transcriptional regulator
MNNPSFYLLVQHLGSAANQEQLRLLKLESVLYANDKRSVDGFFSEITDFFQDKNYQTLFTLPENQQAVKQLFDKFITEQQEKNQWQGNAQAILEKLNLAYLKPALYRVRLLWLSEILFNINAFAQRNILERQTQDLNLHFNNLAVPNDEMALIQFMGVNTIEQVKKLIMQRLDCLEVGLDATVLNLLSQYINSTELRKDSISWPLLDSKLGYYNLAQAAIQSLQAQDYPDLLDKFQKLRSELAAAQLLEKSNKAEIFLQKRNYYKMTLKKLEQIIVEKFKYNLLPPSIIANQYSVKNLNLDYFDTMIEPFYHEFIQRAIKDLSVADVVTDLYQHKTVIAKKSFDLIHSLDPDYIQNLNLTGQDAIMFRNSLSFATRRLLGEKLKLLASGLPNLNPLTKAIMAFHSLLFIEENNFKALSQPHFNVLKSFKIKRQRYPKIGEAMVKQVIDSLKQATFINDIALFHEYNSNFLDNLSKWLEPNTLAQLTHELLNRIKQLQAMTANKQIEQQRTEWLCYRKLLDIVLMSKNEELVLAIDEMVDAAYAHVNKSLQVLEKNIDRNIEHTPVNNWFTLRSISENLESLLSVGALHQPSFIAESDIIQEERNLLKDALFVRAFGNASHQKYLTEFLEKIGLKQRRAMMRGVFNPFIEHGLEFVDNLMTLAGTPEQRRRNADLVAAWCSYRQNQQPGNISQVRKLALQEALPQYGRYLQHNIYHYFGEQFGFIDSKLYTYFCKKLQNLASKWVASSHLVEPAEIWEAERGFFERLMQDISQQRKKNIYNLFTNPNKEKYVARLYIAFCLNVRAQQLIKIWQDKLQSNNLTQVQYFSASTMESALTKMLVDLTEQFGVSSQRYKQALTVTIASQASIFVCWAPTQTKPLELLSSAQLTEKMKA